MRSRGTHVVVGVGDDRESVAALRFAAWEADHRRLPLVVVHGIQPPYVGPGQWIDPGPDLRQGGEALTRQFLAETDVPDDLRVSTVVEVMPPLLLLAAAAADAALVVLGRHRPSLGERLVRGSIAGPLAANAHCPVVIVPEVRRAGQRSGPVVVALDATSSGEEALEFAYREAELRDPGVPAGPMLQVLHAVPLDLIPVVFAREGAWRTVALAEILAGWKADHPDVRIDTAVVHAEPVNLILERSRDAALMVVGRPHTRRFGSWTRSVARAVLSATQCPLAVVPATPRPPS